MELIYLITSFFLGALLTFFISRKDKTKKKEKQEYFELNKRNYLVTLCLSEDFFDEETGLLAVELMAPDILSAEREALLYYKDIGDFLSVVDVIEKSDTCE